MFFAERLVITAVRAGDCPLPKINSRTSVDHVVRRSLPEESGRCREKLCQLRSAIVADNRRSVWETALPWEAETIRPPSARTRAGQGGNGYPVVLTRVQRCRFQRD